MERLTRRGKKNRDWVLINKICSKATGAFCPNASSCDQVGDRTCPYLEVVDRLCEYEETNLEPSEILALKQENERLKAERRWIPIAERTPCISDGKAISNTIHVVLCFFADGYMVVFDIDDIDRWNDFDSKYKITHWMPLPEPPKEEGGEKSRER
jgi:hypothetical protein